VRLLGKFFSVDFLERFAWRSSQRHKQRQKKEVEAEHFRVTFFVNLRCWLWTQMNCRRKAGF